MYLYPRWRVVDSSYPFEEYTSEMEMPPRGFRLLPPAIMRITDHHFPRAENTTLISVL